LSCGCDELLCFDSSWESNSDGRSGNLQSEGRSLHIIVINEYYQLLEDCSGVLLEESRVLVHHCYEGFKSIQVDSTLCLVKEVEDSLD